MPFQQTKNDFNRNEKKNQREFSNKILFKLNKERLRAILAYNIEDETEERAYRHKKKLESQENIKYKNSKRTIKERSRGHDLFL